MTEFELEEIAQAKEMLAIEGMAFDQAIADKSAAAAGRYELRNILYCHYLAAGHDYETAFYMSEN